MRKPNVFSSKRALPRMSWSPKNLYNLYQRTVTGEKKTEYDFRASSTSLFQQRWISKRLLRAYHGDHIRENSFKKWYIPRVIPDVRPPQVRRARDVEDLDRFRGATRRANIERERKSEMIQKGIAPVGSLMWAEIERRIDVFVFRCCFAHSVYEARRMIIHGYCKLNGRSHNNANTRLAPGDMVSIDPVAISFLQGSNHYATVDVKAALKEAEASRTEEESKESIEQVEGAVENSWRSRKSKEDSEAESSNSWKDLEEPSPPSRRDRDSTPPRRPLNPKELERGLTYLKSLTSFHPPAYSAPWLFIPAYIEVSFATCSAIYVRHPTARPNYSEIPTPYDADGDLMRLAWEWYTKRRPRIRSWKKLALGPENRVR